MTNPNDSQLHIPDEAVTNSLSAGASWGGSVASADLAPKGAGADLHQGAQVRQASTEGGPKPAGEERSEPPPSPLVRRAARPSASAPAA